MAFLIYNIINVAIVIYYQVKGGGDIMSKNTKLLYCILGSVILALTSIPTFYDAVHYIPVVGFYLSQLICFISGIGVILTTYFAILLIKENWSFK